MSRCAGLAVATLLLFAACSPPRPTGGAGHGPRIHTFAGGCAGTALTDATPPAWAQGGWSVAKGASWPVPWAMGSHGDLVAFLFAIRLVAGSSPRVDGTNNKVLWVTRDSVPGGRAAIEARPWGASQPVVTIAAGPSFVDLPRSGCWTFQPSWTPRGRAPSTVDLEVLPAGTPP